MLNNDPFSGEPDEPPPHDASRTAAPRSSAAAPTRRRRFRAWRRSRPFWGGLITLIAGLEIAVIPLTAYKIILVSSSVAIAATVGGVIAVLGLMMWMTPSQNKLYGLLTVLLGVVSFVTSNLGGFLLGGLLAIVGGALGFAWVVVTPPANAEPARP
jgi:hypothetical protein